MSSGFLRGSENRLESSRSPGGPTQPVKGRAGICAGVWLRAAGPARCPADLLLHRVARGTVRASGTFGTLLSGRVLCPRQEPSSAAGPMNTAWACPLGALRVSGPEPQTTA